MINKEYLNVITKRIIKVSKKSIRSNPSIQKIYNSNNYYELLCLLQEYNLSIPVPLLACGMSSYFNDQVKEKGLSDLKLTEEDISDAKFIASCFGKTINYSDNSISSLYVTLLGTTEFNYGMQSFPAGIYEDVFQCSTYHDFPIDFIVGESEEDYYCRVLKYQISMYPNFPIEKREEVLARGRRLANKFCTNTKNRIYLIPASGVMDNKASFGDIKGLRDGKATGEELEKIMDSTVTLKELLEVFRTSINNYDDVNLTSEFGIALYGHIETKGVTYIEIPRAYELIQQKAISMGYKQGDHIPKNFNYLEETSISYTK